MKTVWIVLGGIVLLGVIVAMTVIGGYNRLVTLSEGVDNQWAQVESQLQRRSDLIPNLVNTVKGYATHEKEVFENVANARAQLAGARTVNEKINASQAMDSALSRLLAIAENYPQLKANENFIRLQDELAGTENRIAVARMRYNDAVRSYNVMVRRFPTNIVAGFTGFEKKDVYFKSDAKAQTAPAVNF